MEIKKNSNVKIHFRVFSIFVMLGVFCGFSVGHAFTLGETYDKTNCQEIKDMLPPSIVDWVKKGEWTIKTAAQEGVWKPEDSYYELSKKNEGKFDIDEKGNLIFKGGKLADYYEGTPFPTIDKSDPRVAQKIMANMKSGVYRLGSWHLVVDVRWLGEKGFERAIVSGQDLFYYLNRIFRGGAIPNPNGYEKQQFVTVESPMDVKGVNQMYCQYLDDRLDINWAYVPMLRRVRRMPPGTRSDPYMGSDLWLDMSNGWDGKNSTFTFKYLDEKTVLLPYSDAQKHYVKPEPDGSVKETFTTNKFGYETPGWTGVPWAVTSLVWSPRRVWLIEGIPKDPYYNYGKIIWYIDQENYFVHYFIAFTRTGEYWNTCVRSYTHMESDKCRILAYGDNEMIVDDKIHHATVTPHMAGGGGYFNMSWEKMSPDMFTDTNLRQRSK